MLQNAVQEFQAIAVPEFQDYEPFCLSFYDDNTEESPIPSDEKFFI